MSYTYSPLFDAPISAVAAPALAFVLDQAGTRVQDQADEYVLLTES